MGTEGSRGAARAVREGNRGRGGADDPHGGEVSHAAALSESTTRMNLRTVSIPGFGEAPSRMRHSVEKPTFARGANSLSSAYVSFFNRARTSAADGMEDFMPRMLSDAERSQEATLQSDPERIDAYRDEVPPNLRNVLWQNLDTLMTRAWGRTNLRRLARESGVGVATIARLQELGQNVGVDMLSQLGKPFRRQAWELLSPTLGPFSDEAVEIAHAFDGLDASRKAAAYALIVQILEFGNTGGPPSSPPTAPHPPAPQTPPEEAPPSPVPTRTRGKPQRTR